MGNACTGSQKKHITIPSRVIRVQGSINVLDKAPKTPKSAGLSTGATPSSVIKGDNSASPDKLKNDIQVPGDEDEEGKADEAVRITYDLTDLAIGVHYLEKEFLEMFNKASNAKKKKINRNNSKWDQAFVQNREKFSQTQQDYTLYNHIDLSLREFAVSKTKAYEKMINFGISARYRWSIWKNHLEVDKFYIKDLYENLQTVSSRWETDIKKDLHRTFPSEPYFSAEKYGRIGQKHLFNVLKALSLYFPNIGYAQSMNFLAAFFLLINGGNELETFWAFVSLARDHRFLLMGLFEKGFPLLEFFTYIFYEILEVELPELYKHIKQQQIPDILWLFKWFFTMFLYSFPPQYVMKIWDFVMVHGLFSLIQISIGVVKFLEKDMLGLDTFGIDTLFKHLKGDWLKARSQTIHEHSDATSQMISRPNEKKGTVIVNHVSEVEMENHHNSINNGPSEMSEMHYHFKEFNIEEILHLANKISLTPEKISHYALQYTSKTEKKLPDLYQKFFTEWHTYPSESKKFNEFQREIDFHLMKVELIEKPSKKTVKTSNEVVVSVLDDGQEIKVLEVGGA